MNIVGKVRAHVGVIPRLFARREAKQFFAGAVDCRRTQANVLKQLFDLNAGTRFARDHRLDEVRTVADFRRRIPVADYEYFRPYIEEVKAGRHDAFLGPKNRLLMFSLTSGTTAEAKYIPITERFLSDYRSGWQIWGIQAIDAHPAISERHILQLSSDYDLFRTRGGTPCGNISGLVAACQKRIVQTMYTVPRVVSKIHDSDAKLYTAMRLALADPEVGMVMTANPSMLIQFAKLADREKESLIRDIADGTLSSKFEISVDVRRALSSRTSQRRSSRARELAALASQTGHLLPRDFWPGMELLAVWTGGSVGAYLPTMRQYYGDVALRDHGLSASEGRMTIPIADNRTDGVLDVGTHFFEFIPEAEYGKPNPIVLESHELEVDQNYYILLTTSSGLCRYNICDVVRCTGYYHTTPLLEFLHKGAHMANLTGEKISESQVVAAVRSASEQMHLHLSHFTVSPVWGDPPRYQLLVESCDVEGIEIGESLAGHVDNHLKSLNCEYREKRASGRLAAVAWTPVPEGTWSIFSQRRRKKSGGSLEQYKHPCLVPDLEFGSKLLLEVASHAAEERLPIYPISTKVHPEHHRVAG